MSKTGMRGLRERLGASGPGVVVAVIAIIVALAGTAFAAAKLNGTQKKEVEKIAKKYAGKPGVSGAQGPAGPQGSPGAKGDTGAKGDKGDQGLPGGKGADGKSVEIVGEGPQLCEKSPTEKVPGVTYEIEGSGEENTVCDGAEGSPWAAGGTLPPGATETGAWATMRGEATEAPAPISFSVKLAKPITSAHIHVSGEAGFGTPCAGSADNPQAVPGNLCIYTGEAVAATAPQVWQTAGGGEGASVPGAILYWNLGSEGFATGAYAVTGCSTVTGAEFQCP
jgi:collagen triple helix repeat protein